MASSPTIGAITQPIYDRLAAPSGIRIVRAASGPVGRGAEPVEAHGRDALEGADFAFVVFAVGEPPAENHVDDAQRTAPTNTQTRSSVQASLFRVFGSGRLGPGFRPVAAQMKFTSDSFAMVAVVW